MSPFAQDIESKATSAADQGKVKLPEASPVKKPVITKPSGAKNTSKLSVLCNRTVKPVLNNKFGIKIKFWYQKFYL